MKISRSAVLQFFLFHLYLAVYFLTFEKKDSWSATIPLLLIVLLLVLLEYLRSHLFLSPALLWYVFWLGIIAVGRMDLQLYPFYKTWESGLLFLILLNTAVFFWFYWIGELSLPVTACSDSHNNSGGNNSHNSRYSDSDKISYGMELELRNVETLADLTILLLASACGAFVLNVLQKGVIPQLTGDANSYREAFVKGKFYSIVSMLRFLLAFVPVLIRKTGSRKKKLLLLLFAVIYMGEEMLSGWRTYTLQSMFFLLTGLFAVTDTGSRRVQQRNLLVIAVFGAAAILFFGYIAVTRDKVSGALQEKLEYLLYTLDMYVAPNFLNLQTAMEEVTPVNLPAYSTRAIWSFFFTRQQLFPGIGDIDQSIGAFNVSTYLLQPWGDYGTAGTVLCSAVIAYFSGLSMKLCRKNKTLFSVALLGLMNITIFMLHNNLFPRTKSITMWVILAAVLSRVFCRKDSTNGKQSLADSAG